jgi:hypothetical protein
LNEWKRRRAYGLNRDTELERVEKLEKLEKLERTVETQTRKREVRAGKQRISEGRAASGGFFDHLLPQFFGRKSSGRRGVRGA